jgi:hypothetical protein
MEQSKRRRRTRGMRNLSLQRIPLMGRNVIAQNPPKRIIVSHRKGVVLQNTTRREMEGNAEVAILMKYEEAVGLERGGKIHDDRVRDGKCGQGNNQSPCLCHNVPHIL